MCENNHKTREGCCCRGGLLRGFIQPLLLLQLAKQPAHGYELIETLGQAGEFASADPGNLYRLLRGLEDKGLVCSEWDTSGAGPARRIYMLTEQGTDHLRKWAGDMRETRQKLDAFLIDYETYINNQPYSGDVS